MDSSFNPRVNFDKAPEATIKKKKNTKDHEALSMLYTKDWLTTERQRRHYWEHTDMAKEKWEATDDTKKY